MIFFSRSMKLTRFGVAFSAAILLAGLAGCGNTPAGSDPSSPNPSGDATASSSPVPVVNNLDSIVVKGDAGKEPNVSGPFPFKISETQSKVLSAGTGPTISDASEAIEINYFGVNTRTAAAFDSSFARKKAAVFTLDQVVPGFKKGLIDKKVGDKVLIAMTGEDGYDSSGGNSQAGIELGDTLLFVVEILGKSYAAATGETVAPVAGQPGVTFSDGKPTVTIPQGVNPPTGLVVQTLIKGPGRKIVAEDAVSVRYTMVDWATGNVVESTYGGDIQTGTLSKLIVGWREGIIGQTAGSRILLVVPPDKAYPDGNATPAISKDATLVCVIDLLFAQPV